MIQNKRESSILFEIRVLTSNNIMSIKKKIDYEILVMKLFINSYTIMIMYIWNYENIYQWEEREEKSITEEI